MNDNLALVMTFKAVDLASKEIKALEGNLKRAASNWERLGNVIGTSMRAGATIAVAAYGAAITQAINYADATADAAARVGISADEMSRLGFAAKLSGSDVNEMETALTKLNSSIIDAQKENSKAAGAFEYLGISVKNADGSLKGSTEVLREISDRFKDLPDGPTKTALAMDTLGRSSTGLIPLLNGGSEGIDALGKRAEFLGVVLNDVQTKIAGDFNDALDEMGGAIVGAGLSFTEDLIPAVTVSIKAVTDFLATSPEVRAFGTIVAGAFKIAVTAISVILLPLRQATVLFQGLFGAALEAASGNLGNALAVLGDIPGNLAAVNKSTLDYIKNVWNSNDAVEESVKQAQADAKAKAEGTKAIKEYTRGTDDAAKAAEKLANEQKKSREAADQYLSSLRDQLEDLKGVSAEQSAIRTLEQDRYKYATEAQRTLIVQTARQLDQLKELKREYQSIAQAASTFVTQLYGVAQEFTVANKLWSMLVRGSFNQYAIDGKAYNDVLMGIAQETSKLVGLQFALTKARQDPVPNAEEIKDLEKQIKGQEFLVTLLEKTRETRIANGIALNKQNQENQVFIDLVQSQRDEVEQFNVSMNALNKAFEAGAVKPEEYKEALRRLGPGFSELEKFGAEAAQALESSFGDFFFEIMQGNLTDLVGNFKRAIDRMVADALAAKLAESLLGIGGRGGAGALGAAGSFLSGLIGRENGGPVYAGQPYIVGEKRPEVFVPRQNGSIVPSVGEYTGETQGRGNSLTIAVTAMDSQSVIGALDKVKRQAAEMLNGTNRTYNMRTT